MKDFKVKKRIPNIILGVFFAWLAVYFTQTFWAYIFVGLSVLFSVFTDKIINFFVVELKEDIKITDSVEVVLRDKDGNIKEIRK